MKRQKTKNPKEGLSMKTVRLAILGLGNVPLALLRYMREKGIKVLVTGVTTGSRGNAINEAGIGLEQLTAVGKQGDVSVLNSGPVTRSNLEFIAQVPADILLVATPASIPSVEEIEATFARGMSVVTSNKTPVATAFGELKASAKKHGVQFRYGATVLAGYPPWAQFFESVSRQDISEIQIVVNATSNNILTLMLEKGMSFEAGIAEAQRLGIAERDPSDDVDGHDTQKKLAILANVLMDADLTPADIPTTGIRDVAFSQLKAANEAGKWVQLLGRAWREGGKVRAEVKPTSEIDNPFFVRMRGTSMGLYFKTKTPGANFGIWLDLPEGEQAIMATAAGVFEDFLSIVKTRQTG